MVLSALPPALRSVRSRKAVPQSRLEAHTRSGQVCGKENLHELL